MSGIGWNFGDNIPAAAPSAPIGSGWSNNYPSAPPPPPQSQPYHQQPAGGPIGIGFIINEPPSPMGPPDTPQQAQPYPTDPNYSASNYLHPAPEIPTRRSNSINVPKRPPPPRRTNYNSASFEIVTPDGDTANVPGKAKSEINSRPSSRRSEAYEQGLNDMADLMTTVDLDEAEKRRLRERFALQ